MARRHPISTPDFNYKAHELAHDDGNMLRYGAYVYMSKSKPQAGIGRKFFADRNGQIELVYAWTTDSTPASTLTVDVKKNNGSIFSGVSKPTVPVGEYLGKDAVPSTRSFSKGDKLEVEIVSTGGVTGRIGVLIRFTY